MICDYFGQCGSCTLHDLSYQEQLTKKVKKIKEDFNFNYIDIIKSQPQNFRYRAEFRIYHDDSGLHYAMNDFNKRLLKINSCQIVSPTISNLMQKLLPLIKTNEYLRKKLFAVEFLTSTKGESIITLIYHKKLDATFIKEAKKTLSTLDANIIGRSRGVKIVVQNDYIHENLTIFDKTFKYKLLDSGFTQPNPKVNQKMIEWVIKNIKELPKVDLLELYCGLGNFTLPLSYEFRKVLATEVSKASIKSALTNVELNSINNISFIRLSSQELVEAMDKKREFKRLKDIDLDEYNFSTIFVDPPRAGVDEKTIEFLKRFDSIIYISCNPKTLKRDLDALKNYEIQMFATFDQFAYTNHLECGVILRRKK